MAGANGVIISTVRTQAMTDASLPQADALSSVLGTLYSGMLFPVSVGGRDEDADPARGRSTH